MISGALALGLRLSLVALLLRPVGGELRPLIMAVAAVGLLSPTQLGRPAIWAALALLASVRVLLDWPLPDNHAYLLAYWSGAVALVLAREGHSEVALARAATLLIGCVFAFASLWKLLLSPDFLAGDFMRFTWLVDERFAAATRWLGGLDPAEIDANRAFLAGARGAPEALTVPDRLRWLTGTATVFTALIEPAIAVAYLWPTDRGPATWRTPLLLTFCATTFALAPVVGFAWLLLSMEAVRAGSSRRAQWAVVAVFGLVFAYGQAFEAGALERLLG